MPPPHHAPTRLRPHALPSLLPRAAKTLLVYLQELNPIVFQWLYRFMEQNPIPSKQARARRRAHGPTYLRTTRGCAVDHQRPSLFAPPQAPWDDISGETFLRNLLYAPTSEAKMETVRAGLERMLC